MRAGSLMMTTVSAVNDSGGKKIQGQENCRIFLPRKSSCPVRLRFGSTMEVHELVIEMKLLECRWTLYEVKYGILSEDFYAALMAGKLACYDKKMDTV